MQSAIRRGLGRTEVAAPNFFVKLETKHVLCDTDNCNTQQLSQQEINFSCN